MADMRLDDGHGERAIKVLIGIVSGLAGGISGALAAGIWLGTMRADLLTHIDNPEIHQSRVVKEGIAQTVVDREVKPALAEVQRRLERIENKLDQVQATQQRR